MFRSAAVVLAAAAAALPAGALAQGARRPAPSPARSKLLWATVNVCDTGRYPHTIGVRASMPGDGAKRERMRVRLVVQYRSRTNGSWLAVGHGGDSGWIGVGAANVRARQAGERFRFMPTSDPRGTLLRGVATFEWRRGRTLVRRLRRVTSRG